MTHLRYNEIVNDDVADEASSEKYDLSEAGKLTAIMIKVVNKVTLSQPTTERRITNHMTKFEVMGVKDKTIKSIRGLDLQAYHALKTGKMPPAIAERVTSRYPNEIFTIPFGRYVGDPLLYLDLAKDDDIDLRITNDFDTTTYWTNDQLKYTIFEVFLPDATPPELGFIRTYEHSYWASANGETPSKKLEVGNKVFNIKLRAETDHDATTAAASNSLYNVIRSVTVDFKNKRDVIMADLETIDYNWLLASRIGGLWTQILSPYIQSSGKYIICDIGYIFSAVDAEYLITSGAGWTGLGNSAGDTFGVYVNAAKQIRVSVSGIMPYGSIIIPFDEGYPEKPLLDTNVEKPVYVRVHSHTDTGDIYMNVEELGNL